MILTCDDSLAPWYEHQGYVATGSHLRAKELAT